MSTNIDTNEVAKFSKLASEWWDLNGVCKPLHEINPIRLRFIQQHCQLTDNNIIDIGCGGGILSESLAAAGANVTGIDMSEEAIAVATQHAQEQQLKINYQVITAEEIAAAQPQQFDIVTCMELLEHVPEPVSVIKACSDLVKPNGYVFFATINRNPKAYLQAILGAEYILGLLPKGTHDYQKFLKPSELDRWCREANLTTKALAGMNYNPLSKIYSLSKNVSVNYLICCQKTA